MTQSFESGGGAPVVRRRSSGDPTPAPPFAAPGRSDDRPGPEGLADAVGTRGAGVPGTIDEFVDAVVERIEQRVVDELERRGRSRWTGF